MANEKRLIEIKITEEELEDIIHGLNMIIDRCCEDYEEEPYLRLIEKLENAPTADAVEVVRIEETKQAILQTLDTLIATHRDISNSAFSEYEKHLDIPKSSNDYYGIYADTMEIARRLVNAALTDLCENCGATLNGRAGNNANF